jgi:hypothetical protein
MIRIGKSVAYFTPTTGGTEPGWNVTNGGGWVWSVSDALCVREIIPLPNLPLPTFKNPFSAGHFLNALALFVQLFKK